MARQTLPPPLRNNGGPAFLPSLQKEMNRLLEQFKSNFPMLDDDDTGSVLGVAGFPAIDIVETDDAVEVSAELPGVSEEDLDVSVSGGTLVLKGEKSATHEEKEENYHVIERRYGSFRRQIPLGFEPDDDAVDARFKDGVLTLSIAKPATAKAEIKKISIKKT